MRKIKITIKTNRKISIQMNPLSLLHLQNKSFDSKVNDQAKDIFEKISKAIIQDNNYIEYEDYIYPINRCILQMKGYYVEKDKIVWNDFQPLKTTPIE
jgi:hypothetical protein